jgi:hypothetical protein
LGQLVIRRDDDACGKEVSKTVQRSQVAQKLEADNEGRPKPILRVAAANPHLLQCAHILHDVEEQSNQHTTTPKLNNFLKFRNLPYSSNEADSEDFGDIFEEDHA